MLDFEVQRCTRRCAATGRELVPGEPLVSVLVANGSQVVRHDYAADAWTEPPQPNLGWWRSRVPEGSAQRVVWAPNDVLLDYFERLESDPTQLDVRYVLTLLLVRRRLLRVEKTATDAQGQEQLVVYCSRSEREHRVAAVMPDDERARVIQRQLTALLFGDPAARPTLLETPATGAAELAASENAEPVITDFDPALANDDSSDGALAPDVAAVTSPDTRNAA